MSEHARYFTQLHVPGDPLVVFNVWDAGSARVAVDAGVRAVGTGSWSVAAAHGMADGEAMPLDLVLANAERIVRAVEVPVTIDFESGYASEPDWVGANISALSDTGAVGCNLEDQRIGASGIYTIDEQAARITAARKAAPPDFFINARTDLFLIAPRNAHGPDLVEEAIARAYAYAEAGASGFFAPGLVDAALIEHLCAHSPIPVNVMMMAGCPGPATLAACGVARISHGPAPYREAMACFARSAREAMAARA